MNSQENTDSRDAELAKLFVHLESSYRRLETFGCFVALSQDKETLFWCPMLADGTPEMDEGHMNWGEVTAPEPEFMDEVNSIFGTAFDWRRFSGR